MEAFVIGFLGLLSAACVLAALFYARPAANRLQVMLVDLERDSSSERDSEQEVAL